MEIIMESAKETCTSEDIVHVREELMLTVHEVAVSLSKRTRDPKVLLDISSDLMSEARKLRSMAR
jgi:hypothetical protein